MLGAFVPLKAQAMSSVESSKSSDTAATDPVPIPTPTPTARAPDDVQKIINSCAAAAVDLEKTRGLVTALETENGLLKTRLDTEKRTSAVLLELNETRKLETASLRETIAAKNETIVAKGSVIESQDTLIAALKKKKSSPLKRITDVLIGVGLLALFR
jgi:hypothetical protein